MRASCCCLVSVILFSPFLVTALYNADWESLDTRPTPSWFDEAKIGIFIHWGVYSVPSFGHQGFWWEWQGVNDPATVNYMKENWPPNWTYQNFGPMFTAEFFNATAWAKLFKDSGAKYIVLSSKHYEGFTLWPSARSFGWSAMDIGPQRDLVGELSEAVRDTTDLKFGLHYVLDEFFNPLLIQDKANNYTTQDYVETKMYPEMKDIVDRYKPSVLWGNGGEVANSKYFNTKEFLAWLFNESPVKDEIAVNDRWGSETYLKHGGFYTFETPPGVLQPHKWELYRKIDHSSWGYRRTLDMDDVLSMDELVQLLASTVSCGGNFLLNVGPAHDGKIRPIFQERLLQMGEWLDINGDAIYGTKPWAVQTDTYTTGIWYTEKSGVVYGILLEWQSKDSAVIFGSLTGQGGNQNLTIQMLGDEEMTDLKWEVDEEDHLVVTPHPLSYQTSKWGWTFVFHGLQMNELTVEESDNV